MYNNSYNKQATVLQQKTDVVNRCITQNASLLVVPKRLNALSIAFQPYMDRNRAMPAALPRLVARCHPHTVVCAHTHTHMQMLKKHFPKNNKRQQTIDNKQKKKKRKITNNSLKLRLKPATERFPYFISPTANYCCVSACRLCVVLVVWQALTREPLVRNARQRCAVRVAAAVIKTKSSRRQQQLCSNSPQWVSGSQAHGERCICVCSSKVSRIKCKQQQLADLRWVLGWRKTAHNGIEWFLNETRVYSECLECVRSYACAHSLYWVHSQCVMLWWVCMSAAKTITQWNFATESNAKKGKRKQ